MTEHEKHLLNLHMRREFRNELAHLKTRQGSFEASMWHFEHPIPGSCRTLDVSDNGEASEKIFAKIEVQPLWEKLYYNAYMRLPATGKKVFNALEVEWRSCPAARIAHVNRKTVDLWKKKFKVHFAQCFRAYHRDLRKKQLPTF